MALGRGVRSSRVSGASLVRIGEPKRSSPAAKKSCESAWRRLWGESVGIWKENDASEGSGRWHRLSSEPDMVEETWILGTLDGLGDLGGYGNLPEWIQGEGAAV
jgi:hypothetical protein